MKAILYEIQLLDRKEAGLLPWRYSGSSYVNGRNYMGSSTHKDYKSHLAECKNVKKIIIAEFDKSAITVNELRAKEREWQVSEDHKNNPEYYNKTNSSWSGNLSNKSILKMRDKIIKLGLSPYSEKTHSPETIAKSRETKAANKQQWWHDPITHEYRMIKTAYEKVPDGWIRGRKPKVKGNPKVRGVDYICNTKDWDIYKDGVFLESTSNLKKWCSDNSVPYLAHKKYDYNLLTSETKILISKTNGIIHENNKSTGVSPSNYAEYMGVGRSTVSSWIGQGYRKEKTYTNIKAKEKNK